MQNKFKIKILQQILSFILFYFLHNYYKKFPIRQFICKLHNQIFKIFLSVDQSISKNNFLIRKKTKKISQ